VVTETTTMPQNVFNMIYINDTRFSMIWFLNIMLTRKERNT